MSVLLAAGGALDLCDPQKNEVLTTFVTRAQQTEGQDARVVIVTISSAEPQKTAADYTAVFQALGVAHITPFDLTSRTEANQIDLAPLHQATGIYLSGGNQLRLTALINGTAVASALHTAYQRGAVILGSSAGTAALSALMLAYGDSGLSPRQGMAYVAQGLGLVNGLILDQHFSQRERLGRLLTAVANNPALLGVGIDENTAVLIEDDQARVLGEQSVTFVDGHLSQSNAVDCQPGDPINLADMRLHRLLAGDYYDLATHTPHLAPIRSTFA